MLDGVDIYDFPRYYSQRTNILKKHRQKKKTNKETRGSVYEENGKGLCEETREGVRRD